MSLSVCSIGIAGDQGRDLVIFVLSPNKIGISEGRNLEGSSTMVMSVVEKDISISRISLMLYAIPEQML